MDEISVIFRQRLTFFFSLPQIFVEPGKCNCALPLHTKKYLSYWSTFLSPVCPDVSPSRAGRGLYPTICIGAWGWRTPCCCLRSDTSALPTCSLT